jgi:hypothetical protein
MGFHLRDSIQSNPDDDQKRRAAKINGTLNCRTNNVGNSDTMQR